MSLFGELQLGFSRAVSDDEDEELSTLEQDEKLKRKIHWLNEEARISVDEIILADGPTSCAFLHVYLMNHLNETEKQVIGITGTNSEFKIYQTNQSYEKNDSYNHSLNKIRNNFIYLVKNLNGKSFLICELFSQLKSSEFYDWIDQLWAKVEFKSSLILCSQNKSNYYGTNAEEFPCVKFISSDKTISMNEINCKRLEEPNFVQNLPAALIHFCMLKNLEFTAFVCFSGSLNVDLQSVKTTYAGVSNLLRNKCVFTDNDLSKKTLLSIGNIVNSASALYM